MAKQPTLADLCERATINEVAANCVNMWSFYGITSAGLVLSLLSGVWWTAPIGLAIAIFDGWNRTKASYRKEQEIRAHPGAWMKYSGIPLKELQAKQRLLNTPLTVLDARTIAAHQLESLPALPAVSGATGAIANDEPDIYPLQSYLKYFLYAPLAVIGAQGSGKSTVLKLVAQMKRAAGHQVKVLNPHAMPADWQGFEIIGGGHDFEAVNQFLEDYPEELKRRYAAGHQSGMNADDFRDWLAANHQALSIVCDEMSNWSGAVDAGLLHRFALSSITESRKVCLPPVFGVHGDKLHDYGLTQGADRKDQALVKAILDDGYPDPATGQIIATGKGTLRLPNGQTFRFYFERPTDPEPAGTPELGDEAEPITLGDRLRQAVNGFKAAIDAPTAPQYEQKRLANHYLTIYPECATLSDVMTRMGTQLYNAGLIRRRTVGCLRGWLNASNLPFPGDEADNQD